MHTHINTHRSQHARKDESIFNDNFGNIHSYIIMMLSTSLMVNITVLNIFCSNTFCVSLKYFLCIRFHIHCPVSKINMFYLWIILLVWMSMVMTCYNLKILRQVFFFFYLFCTFFKIWTKLEKLSRYSQMPRPRQVSPFDFIQSANLHTYPTFS